MKQAGRAGAARERQVRKVFDERGFVTFKSSDSAIADVIAMRAAIAHVAGDPQGVYEPRAYGFLIEVKANAGGPWMHFRKPERKALSAVAHRAGLVPLLVHWPPRMPMREYLETEWPGG